MRSSHLPRWRTSPGNGRRAGSAHACRRRGSTPMPGGARHLLRLCAAALEATQSSQPRPWTPDAHIRPRLQAPACREDADRTALGEMSGRGACAASSRTHDAEDGSRQPETGDAQQGQASLPATPVPCADGQAAEGQARTRTRQTTRKRHCHGTAGTGIPGDAKKPMTERIPTDGDTQTGRRHRAGRTSYDGGRHGPAAGTDRAGTESQDDKARPRDTRARYRLLLSRGVGKGTTGGSFRATRRTRHGMR